MLKLVVIVAGELVFILPLVMQKLIDYVDSSSGNYAQGFDSETPIPQLLLQNRSQQPLFRLKGR